MPILAQSGYGRGNKVTLGIQEGSLAGVIMSPRDERQERLILAVSELVQEHPEAKILFDPQFYASVLTDRKDGHLSQYDYYGENSGLRRADFRATRISRIVNSCLDFQVSEMGGALWYLIAPSLSFDDFTDSASQIALNMANEACGYANAKHRVLVTVAVSETALTNRDALDEYLDVLTTLDCAGFYIVLKRNSPSAYSSLRPDILASLMYLHYVLSELNGYVTVCGYTDWNGLLIEAVGASNTSAGWYQNLRQFSLDRFQPSGGGRRPRPRYSSAPLLGCPLIVPELEEVFQAGLLESILSEGLHDELLADGPESNAARWTDEISCLAHWHSLSRISSRITSVDSVTERLAVVDEILTDASLVYTELAANGIQFEAPVNSGIIDGLQEALMNFKRMTELS